MWYLKTLVPEGLIGSDDYIGGANYTYQFIEKYPDRLILFDAVNPLEPGCVDWIKEKAKIGLKGVKWLPAHYGEGSSVDGPEAQVVFETCVQLKLPLVLSFEGITPNAPYTPKEYGRQLEAAAERFPDLKIGLYHAGFGLPNMLEKEATIRTVKQFDNLYMSTALFWVGDNEYPFRSCLAIIEELAERLGVEKLMWATDWPWTEWFCKYRQMVTAVQNHANFLSDSEKARFMGGTAIEFLYSTENQFFFHSSAPHIEDLLEKEATAIWMISHKPTKLIAIFPREVDLDSWRQTSGHDKMETRSKD